MNQNIFLLIISESNCFGLKYDDILDKNILFFSDGDLQINFKVVGVIDNNSKLPVMLEGGTVKPAVEFILNKVSKVELIILNSDHLPRNTYSMLTSKLIFLDGISSTSFIEKYSALVSQYGRLAALNDMKIQQWVKSALNYREDIIIFFSLLFLLVFSVIGYNLIEIKHKERLIGTLLLCGMSKRRLTIDRFISSLILYFCAYIVSIPICIKINYVNEVLSVYLFMIAALIIGFMFLTCFITNHLISKFDLSNIIRSE